VPRLAVLAMSNAPSRHQLTTPRRRVPSLISSLAADDAETIQAALKPRLATFQAGTGYEIPSLVVVANAELEAGDPFSIVQLDRRRRSGRSVHLSASVGCHPAVQEDIDVVRGGIESPDGCVDRAPPSVGRHRRQTTSTAGAARIARTATTATTMTQAWQVSPIITANPPATTLVDVRESAAVVAGVTGRLNARHTHNTASGNATANPVTTFRPKPGSHKPNPRAWTTAKPTTTRPDSKRRARSG
jgi:hypothetical protein